MFHLGPAKHSGVKIITWFCPSFRISKKKRQFRKLDLFSSPYYKMWRQPLRTVCNKQVICTNEPVLLHLRREVAGWWSEWRKIKVLSVMHYRQTLQIWLSQVSTCITKTAMSIRRAVAVYRITDRRSDETVREELGRQHQNGPKQLGYFCSNA